jgi:aminoglycoside phosphotransferase (APT) family kinase protein
MSIVSQARIGEAISKQFPELDPVEPLSRIGEGFRSLALETAGGVIVRIGKTAEAAAGFALEAAALPVVARHVRAPVPAPCGHVTPCNDFPFGALAYPKLPGTAPVPGNVSLRRAFIPELARFLVELHSVPVDEAQRAGVAEIDAVAGLLSLRHVVERVLSARLSASDRAHLGRWWDRLSGLPPTIEVSPVLCHSDLWYENLLVDSAGGLGGVLDWSELAVTDFALDFAAVHHFGEPLALLFIEEYRAAGGTISVADAARIDLYWQARELRGLAWAVAHDDAVETEDAIRKLLTGPLFG